jgi:DNA-binding IclR family transcriptional regulator
VPLHATSSGKAFLAHLDPAERDGLLGTHLEGFTKTTVTDRATLEAELAAARQDGYAVCVGELEESLYGASSAVLSEQGRPIAIVSVWGPDRRVPKVRLPAIGELTVDAAERVRLLLR